MKDAKTPDSLIPIEPAFNPSVAPPGPNPAVRREADEFVQSVVAKMTSNKRFKGRVMVLSSDSALCHVRDYVSAQCIAIDRALGTPGIPLGKVTEIFGWEGVGKSTVVDHLLAETQRRGGIAVLLDTEEARQLSYSANIGVDCDNLVILQATNLEDAFAMIDSFLDHYEKKGEDRLLTIAFDAIGGTPSKAELVGEAGDKHVGVAARVIKMNLRRICQRIADLNVAMVFANHQYTKIGGMPGDTTATYGGKGLPYYATIRFEVKRGPKFWAPGLSDADRKATPPLGQYGSVGVIKNKVASPWGYGRFALIYGVGLDNTVTIFDDLVALGRIVKSGSWCSLIDLDGVVTEKWQGGWLHLRELCIENPALYQTLAEIHQGALPKPEEGEEAEDE